MRSIGASLKAAIQAGTSTLATIWKITLTNGTIYRFTSHDQDIVVPSDGTYLSTNSFKISATTTSLSGGSQNTQIDVILSDDANSISVADLRAGLFDKAAVSVSWLNYEDPSQGTVVIVAGFLGPWSASNKYSATFEIVGRLQSALQGIGLKYLPECRHDFCDANCGLTITDYDTTGTVADFVYSNLKFRATIAGAPDNYLYSLGSIEWVTGANAGLFQEVIQQVAFDGTYDDILLSLNMPYDIQLGDTFKLYQGCMKTPTACKAYGNIVNYGGFPFVPGPDFIKAKD